MYSVDVILRSVFVSRVVSVVMRTEINFYQPNELSRNLRTLIHHVRFSSLSTM